MKLLSLRLRGAIGIYDGLGVDEINIDFTKFESGTICVYGDNGAGKTTLIENLTPFRKLFSRPGSLAGQFRLKDSCRDLLIELGPDQYRFLININADSGKIESYVYRNGEVVNADGKEGSYNEIVFDLFGSPDLFTSSLFMPQKRTPFSKLSPERREELFNLEGIRAKARQTADNAKDLQSQISELTGRIGQLESTLGDLTYVDGQIEIARKLVADREQSIAETELLITNISEMIAKFEEEARGQVALKTELESIDKAIKQLQLDKTSIGYEHKKKLEKLEAAIGVTKGDIAAQERLLEPDFLQRMRELVTKRAELAAEIEAHVEAHGKHVQATTELSTARNDLRIAETKLRAEYEKLADGHTDAKQSAKLIYEVPCQELADDEERKRCESCQFLQDAIAAENKVPELERLAKQKHEEYLSVTTKLEAKIATAEKLVAESPFDEERAKACKAELAAINAQKPEEYIQRAEVAEEKLNGLRAKLTGLADQHKGIAAEEAEKVAMVVFQIEEWTIKRAAIAGQISNAIDTAILERKNALKQAQSKEKLDRDQLTAAKKDIESLQLKLDQRAEAETKLAECRLSLAALESDQADWTHLSQMLGAFQFYLIETSAVEMTEFANELLKGYDVPWTIEIATSTKTADGKKDKDGFFIFVNTPTGQRELGDLSGGQAVWIDTILQHAVAFAQQRLSGKKLLTKILDEADGALDEERAIAYLNAIQAAHQQTGMFHTILISHRPEIQNMISQRIHFQRGKGIEIERE